MNVADFTKRMRSVPDEELLNVISSDGFVREAVDAARAELERRNVKPDDLARMREEAQEAHYVEESKPFVPLGVGGKIAFFTFGPLLLFSLGAAVALRSLGYRRRSNEGLKWIGISFLFWLCVSIFLDVFVWQEGFF